MINLLLIEDDLVDQMAIWRMVKQHKHAYDLKTADSLAAAIPIIENDPIDLIISDYHLGDGSAMELLENYQQIPIILITGLNDSDAIRRFKMAGAAQVLIKDNKLNYIRSLPAIIEETFQAQAGIASSSTGSHHNGHPNTSRQSSSGNKCIDLTYLSKTFDGNASLIQEMIQTFLAQNPRDLDRLADALEKEDMYNAAMVAHKVKSGYKLMGMQRQQDQAEKIEHEINTSSGELDDIRETALHLINETQKAYSLLRKQLEELES
ncbi:MAG: response regulator [Bacteroidota bacterium]